MKEPKKLHGTQAVDRMEKELGRPLSTGERRIVVEEGYVDGRYLDTKGVETSGVGQTGDYKGKTFEETYNAHVKRAKDRVPQWASLSEDLQVELIQSEYRGDLGASPAAVALLNAGDFEGAAREFLVNEEYKNPATPDSIKARMRATANALAIEALTKPTVPERPTPLKPEAPAATVPPLIVDAADSVMDFTDGELTANPRIPLRR